MSNTARYRKIRHMVDNLTDTMSWVDLAKELDSYAAETGMEASSNTQTIEVADLVKSLGNQK